MKKIYLLYYLLLVSILTACEADPKWEQQVLTYTDSFASSWNTTDVCLIVDEQSNALTQRIEIGYSLNEDFSGERFASMTRNEQGQWIARLTELKDSSTYYVHYHFTPSYLQPEVRASSFQTKPYPKPIVHTYNATAISATTAVLIGKAELGESNDSILERGFYYSLLREGDYERYQVKCGSGSGTFYVTIAALRANATYYFVAYATNEHGVAYGDTLQFNTLNPY